MTVRADIYDGTQPASVSAQISPTLDAIRATLPFGYSVDVGGSVEDAARGQNSIAAGVPMSGVLGRAEIVDAAPDSSIGGTFVGSPLGCVAALAGIAAVVAFALTVAPGQ